MVDYQGTVSLNLCTFEVARFFEYNFDRVSIVAIVNDATVQNTSQRHFEPSRCGWYWSYIWHGSHYLTENEEDGFVNTAPNPLVCRVKQSVLRTNWFVHT